jgi:hypothetical protein
MFQASRIPFDRSDTCARIDAAKRAYIVVPDFLRSSFGDFALQF